MESSGRRTIVIAGGGTGGHVFPGIAVSRELRRRDPHRPLLWIGSRAGLERRLVPAEGLSLVAWSLGGLAGKSAATRAASALQAAVAVVRCLALFLRRRPGAVLGVGGFASGPAGLAAVLLRVPLVIHEQNSVPGATNRFLAHFARAVAVSFPATGRALGPAAARRVEVTGNPIREEFFGPEGTAERFAEAGGGTPDAEMSRGALDAGMSRGTPPSEGISVEDAASRRLHRSQEKARLNLLIFGGSRGARSINRAVASALPLLAGWRDSLAIVHQTGEADLDETRRAHAQAGFASEILPFLDDMPRRMRQANLVVCRAGASTVFELAAVGRPSLLVPFPHAAGGHQRDNARSLEAAGAARLIEDRDLSGATLAAALREMLSDPEHLRGMGQAARALARPDAAARIADLVESAAGESPRSAPAAVIAGGAS